MKKNILITGGAGFLGSYLCRRLLSAGHHVTCLDNFYTGHRLNVVDLEGLNEFELVEHDVVDVLPTTKKFDEIYNLACPAAPGHYQANPVNTLKTCFTGTLNMLELARNHSAKLLQASTSEVYGDPRVHPQPESYFGNVNPVGVRACYDEGKRVAESLCADFSRMHNTDVRIVRIFNTYGPGMHPYDGRAVANFIRQAMHNECISISGTGRQTRSFCYRDDLVRGLIDTMRLEGKLSIPMNLGSSDELSIYDLAQKIIQLTGTESKIIFVESAEDDPKMRKPVLDAARHYIDWRPDTPINNGLQRTIEWFRSIDLAAYAPPTPNY